MTDKCKEAFEKLVRIKTKDSYIDFEAGWNASHDQCHELCHSLLIQDKPVPENDDKWNVGITAVAIAINKDKVKV